MISGNGSTVRIVTFNVRGAVGPDGNVDPDAIADSIIALEPDVVLLQEVTRGWVIHGTMDLLEYLQARLHMTYASARPGRLHGSCGTSHRARRRGALPRPGEQGTP
jgi:endonuclease/exonuclease/phosphatase family metal-dependent hydrolase